jgi:lysophospholipase L1-like esterase
MEIQIFKPHPIIGYTFIPDLKLRVEHEGGGYLLRTNSAGFRSEREFVERSTGKKRLLLFGDSFTAGDGVANKYRYSDLMETLLPDVEVYNFGLPGTGTDQHYLVWREVAKRFDHDAVVIAVQVENIRRVAARYRLSKTAAGEDVLFAKPYFELADGELTLHGVPVPPEPLSPNAIEGEDREFVDQGGRHLWLRNIVNKLGGPVKDLAQRVSGYQPLPEYDDPNGPEWTLMKAILQQWVSEIERPVIVVPVPMYHYVEETAASDAYRARFGEVANFPGVTVHDPLPDYLAFSPPERRELRFKSDIHPTPKHHRLLADSIAGAVRPFLEPAREEATAR